MFTSLQRRILALYGLSFLILASTSSLLGWHFIRKLLWHQAELQLQTAFYDLKQSVREAEFRYRLSLLQGISQTEARFLALNDLTSKLREIFSGSPWLWEIRSEKNVLAGSNPLPHRGISPLYRVLYNSELKIELALAYNPQILHQFLRSYLRTYWISVAVLYFLFLSTLYLAYLAWFRRPLHRVMKALEKGEELPSVGLKEIDLLVQKIRESFKREREFTQRLAFSEKMTALGTLAGGYAHEFNNLLQMISGYLQLARAFLKEGNTEKALEKLERAEKAVLKGSELSSRILGLARSKKIEKAKTEVGKVLTNTLKTLERAFPKHIRVEVQAERDLWVPLSEEVLQEIVMNLTLNARDALTQKEEGFILIRAAEENGTVRLEVEDNGPGIPEEIRSRIFEPFFTTKKIGEGTGLGLYIVHQLVTGAGGKIEVESTPGKGTRFILWLPKTEPEKTQKKETKKPPPSNLSGKRVLVVDDEADIRESLAELLSLLHLEAETASSAEEALKKCRQETYDLLLVDLLMPGKDGLWLIQKLEKEPSRPNIVVITGYTQSLGEELKRKEEQGLIKGILYKPVDLKKIEVLLAEVFK